ncbi:TetR/AcrR family transcriptional regulator [Eggerthellaceae bacterium zg-1084]|uniref:TetR/AcrR family transcriptional regulator n=1 Tax=Berryella wangjianweii TaxID=2734634 RepID=UPI001554FB0C|nr:TetR/AcrR family transcriptional regulator [Berryella wangjianweii]NPD31166.1 TetR/AcrR family transcriptional regulator [Berryella wangjianweii]
MVTETRRQQQAARAIARRDDIVEAARCLYEEHGIAGTSLKSIADEVGVARSLIYHYFPDKDAITDAVLDTYVDDFIELVRNWNESRERGNVRKALVESVRVMRRGLFDRSSLRNDLANNENAGLYLRFSSRVAESLARYVTDTTVRDYASLHTVEIDHVFETFYVLISGMVSLMRRHPDTPDEVLEGVIAQTLHLDLSGTLVDADPADAGRACVL